jgi:hypothetical protein
MTRRQHLGAGKILVVCAAVFIGSVGVRSLRAADDNSDEAKVRIGLEIAPVPLNLAHKNRALVGLGSYIVNAVSGCNGCHSAGPATEFLPGGNPFFGQAEAINPATYLGGGRDFAVTPPPPGATFHIFSRNLTPDHTGLPIGGDTFEEFRETIRTGVDPDQLHANLPPPFVGTLLQVMPWYEFRNMTDRDLRAIYEYLSSVPCVPSTGHVC